MNETAAFEEQIKGLHTQAEGEYRAGDLQSARQIWEAILQIAPDDKRAEEGLRLTSLADANWGLADEACAGTPNRAARIAEIKECLGNGLPGEAAKLAGALLEQTPGDEEFTQLLRLAHEKLESSALTGQAIRDARISLEKGDRQQAAEQCQRVLGLEPNNREATMLLEQAQGLAEPAGTPRGQDLELDLDLLGGPATPSVAKVVSAPVPAPAVPVSGLDLQLDLPPAPARTAHAPAAVPLSAQTQEVIAVPPPPAVQQVPMVSADDPVSVRDLFDAVDEIEDSGHITGESPMVEGTDPARDEAALLVSRARGELKVGNLSAATGLASQAMAITDDTPGAQSVLDQARAAMDQRASRAENCLIEGAALMDGGTPAEAIPLLEQALELIPGHPEVIEYLERARAALPGAGSEPMLDLEDDSSGSIPLDLPPESAGIAIEPAPDGLPSLELGSPPPVTPASEGPASSGPPMLPPPGLDSIAPAHALPSLDTPQPPSAPATGAKVQQKKAGVRTSSSRGLLVSVLVMVLVSVGGWYGYQWWQNRQPAHESANLLGIPLPVLEETGQQEASGSATAEEPPGESMTTPSSDAQAPVARKQYSKRDVPRLRARARQKLEAGKEKEALSLLLVAQDLAPSNFEILDQIQQTRAAARERQAADDRIELGKEAFRDGGYEEALRILYRIPKAYHPDSLNRWLANGWFNLGIRALESGDVVEANRFFSDCIELVGQDPQAQRHQEVARRYRRRSLDDAYRIYVSRLKLRALEDS